MSGFLNTRKLFFWSETRYDLPATYDDWDAMIDAH